MTTRNGSQTQLLNGTGLFIIYPARDLLRAPCSGVLTVISALTTAAMSRGERPRSRAAVQLPLTGTEDPPGRRTATTKHQHTPPVRRVRGPQAAGTSWQFWMCKWQRIQGVLAFLHNHQLERVFQAFL